MYPNAFGYLGIGFLLRYVNAELALLFSPSKKHSAASETLPRHLNCSIKTLPVLTIGILVFTWLVNIRDLMAYTSVALMTMVEDANSN
jgi:hypothetical protein